MPNHEHHENNSRIIQEHQQYQGTQHQRGKDSNLEHHENIIKRDITPIMIRTIQEH